MRVEVVAGLVVIAVLAVGVGYMYLGGGGSASSTVASTVEEPSGAGRGMGGAGVGGEAAGACNGLSNLTVGQSIRWLLDNHGLFTYRYMEFPENYTIVWVINAPNKAAAEILAGHIRQMECVIENGGTPRKHDPLFVVDAAVSREYVETRISWVNDTAIRVVKVAENECAFQVIKLHAEVVRGFFETGRVEAAKTHEIPDYVLETCKPILEELGVNLTTQSP